MRKIIINYIIALFLLIIIFYYKKNDFSLVDLEISIGKNFYLFVILKTLSLILLSIRWNFLCNQNYLKTNPFNSFNQINLGHFLSFFTPGVFAQDAVKFYFIAKLNKVISKKDILVITIYDRLIGLVSFIILNFLIIILFIIYSNKFNLIINNINLLNIKILDISLLILFLLILFFILRKFFLPLAHRLKIFYKVFYIVFFLGILGHFFNLIGFALLILEISNLDFLTNVILVSLSLFGNMFPFTPSGIGITELIFQVLYNLFDNSRGFEIGSIIRYYSFLLITLLTIVSTFFYLYYKKIK